jgi:hypothetical protein
MRKVQPGAKVVVALSLAAQEKASLAARTRARQGPAVKASQSADAMIDRGDGVLEKVSSGLQWTQRDNASDVTWDAAHQYWGAQHSIPGRPGFSCSMSTAA